MFKVKCTISYDGTRYYGWQRQSDFPSIQQVIEDAFSKILQEKITLSGSGRTDRGVHAKKQTASCSIPNKSCLVSLKKSLNALLPDNIRIINLQYKLESFHARYDAKSKAYSYTINTASLACPFSRHFQYHHPYKIDRALLREGIKLFIGTKDFSSFANIRSSSEAPSSNIRSIYNIDLEEDGDILILSFHGNGFLYKMIRNIVGALIDIAEKRVSIEQVFNILENKSNIHKLRQAPAKGLCLEEVFYNSSQTLLEFNGSFC